MNQIIKQIKDSLVTDEVNRVCVAATVVGSLIAYLIWHKLNTTYSLAFYAPFNYYPLEIFFTVWLMHLVISYYSYKIDKNISNLLLAAPVFYIILILVLEVYYWSNL